MKLTSYVNYCRKLNQKKVFIIFFADLTKLVMENIVEN